MLLILVSSVTCSPFISDYTVPYSSHSCVRVAAASSESAVEVIDPAQAVVDGLVDRDEEGEGRGQLHPLAQLLVAPVEAAQPLGQVPSARPLQPVLQQLGLIGLVP